MSALPRISFGMIVLNGEPFTRYTLRALYPYAHEIIVVEGAAPGAANIASADGHSIDGTLESLRAFKADEDPDDKLIIVTRDGFWSEKDEMSKAYAERATGDYLWQVDVDEFYQPRDLEQICQLLIEQPDITAVSFESVFFWAAPQYRVDSWYLRRGESEFHRLFKWGAGYHYVTHRPPTVVDAAGRDLRNLRWIRAKEMKARGIHLYHYALLLPKQVREKCEYYRQAEWARRQLALEWADEAFFALRRPYHAHNVYEYPGCLYRFRGAHPPQVVQMWRDLNDPQSPYDLRPRDEIEALLNSRRYQLGRALVMAANRPALWLRKTRIGFMRLLAQLLPRAVKDALKRL